MVPGRTVRPLGGSATATVMGPLYSFRTTVTGTAAVPPLGILTCDSFGLRLKVGTIGRTMIR